MASPFITSQDSPSNAPLLAIDFDDVLMATNATVAKWHNDTYGTKMTLNDFHYYHYWKNPGWGSPADTYDKVRRFYEGPEFADAPVIPGAIQGVRALRQMGFRLVIVTARSTSMKSLSERWIAKHFPGCFETIHYTGAFDKQEVQQTEHGPRRVTRRMEKIEILQSIGAVALVDDSLDNAMTCALVQNPVPVLLFGDFPWNKRTSTMSDDPSSLDHLSFVERQRLGMKPEDDNMRVLPREIERVADWKALVTSAARFLP